MNDKESAGRLRMAIARLILAGLDDQAIGAQCRLLGSGLCMELGVCPIREEELVGVIRVLLASRQARATTGVSEIDQLTDARARAILARVYRFMYQRRDGTWDPDKDIPGAELVSLLCSEMPEMGRHEKGPDLAGGLVACLKKAGADDSALDDLVHDLASSIGSGVNNEGFAGQVRFLLDEMGLEAGAREIEKVIRGATPQETEREAMNLYLLVRAYCPNEYLDARPHYAVIEVDGPFVDRMLANMRWVRDFKKRKDGDIYAIEWWDYSPEWIANLGQWEESTSAVDLLSGASVADFLSGAAELTTTVSDGGVALVAPKPPIDEDDPSNRTECGTRVVTTDGVKWRAIVKHTSDYVDTATIELATWRKVRAILRKQKDQP